MVLRTALSRERRDDRTARLLPPLSRERDMPDETFSKTPANAPVTPTADDASDIAPGADGRDLAELPPVEPPSAGFIVQLFVVPALIVAVVIGVWVMFGKLASGKQDWQTLVRELGSSNAHRHQRAAVGLAQMLRADLEAGEDGEHLSENQQIAAALASLLSERLDSPSGDEDSLQQQAFLARTLGFLDVPETVLPVLTEAMSAGHDRDIRRDAAASVALIAGRAQEAGGEFDHPEVIAELVDASRDEDAGLRQVVAFTLGLCHGPEVEQRLRVMLSDVDLLTRANAAIALARQDSTAGLPIFKRYLEQAAEPFDPDEFAEYSDEKKAELIEAKTRQEPLVLKNAFKAIQDLSPQLNAAEKSEIVGLLEPLSDSHNNAVVRVEARKLAMQLESSD